MAQNILGNAIGFLPQTPSSGMGTLALSAANTWLAMSFLGNGKTVSTIDLFASALSGTLTAAQLTLDIYSTNSTGDPNASVSGPHNCAAVPATGWNRWSSINYLTTDGTMYWVVIKNIHGTPASNNITLRFGFTAVGPVQLGTTSNLWGWNKNHTTDGSAWTQEQRGTMGMMVGYSDATYDGAPFSNIATAASGLGVYAAREVGALFSFAGPTINVRAVCMYHLTNNGTPTNAARARIYSGSSATPTLVATSSGGPLQGQTGIGYSVYPFASSHALAAGTYRVVFGTTGADAVGNRYNTSDFTIKDEAAARALMPFGNAMTTYTTDGTTFAETNTSLVPFGLILDNGSEFTVAGGGGGLLVPLPMTGGMT